MNLFYYKYDRLEDLTPLWEQKYVANNIIILKNAEDNEIRKLV